MNKQNLMTEFKTYTAAYNASDPKQGYLTEMLSFEPEREPQIR